MKIKYQLILSMHWVLDLTWLQFPTIYYCYLPSVRYQCFLCCHLNRWKAQQQRREVIFFLVKRQWVRKPAVLPQQIQLQPHNSQTLFCLTYMFSEVGIQQCHIILYKESVTSLAHVKDVSSLLFSLKLRSVSVTWNVWFIKLKFLNQKPAFCCLTISHSKTRYYSSIHFGSTNK